MPSIHVCPLSKDCRQFDAPWRVHIETRNNNFGIAFRPGDKFVTSKLGEPVRSSWFHWVKHPV